MIFLVVYLNSNYMVNCCYFDIDPSTIYCKLSSIKWIEWPNWQKVIRDNRKTTSFYCNPTLKPGKGNTCVTSWYNDVERLGWCVCCHVLRWTKGDARLSLQVHLQTQQEVKRRMMGMAIHVVKSDGLLALYNGLSASLCRQVHVNLFCGFLIVLFCIFCLSRPQQGEKTFS